MTEKCPSDLTAKNSEKYKLKIDFQFLRTTNKIINNTVSHILNLLNLWGFWSASIYPREMNLEW